MVFLISGCLCQSGCFSGVWWFGGFPDVSAGLKVFQLYLVGWLFSRCFRWSGSFLDVFGDIPVIKFPLLVCLLS